jgi:hypothetical protein
MDSLMDALTNVVGILLLILIISSLGLTAAVKKVVENLPEVTQEELEAMRVSREKTLKNLEELKQTHTTTQTNLPTPEEAASLLVELEDFEKNNEELADKTSDIEEWQAKVTEVEAAKEAQDALVQVADARNRELAAILAQTPVVQVASAKEVLMPNPRVAEAESKALYFVCKYGRLYSIGDPYEHTLKIRDVIDQNYKDLAYTDKAVGSYTYTLRIDRKHEDGWYLPYKEKVRISRRDREALAPWENLKPKWGSPEGVMSPNDISVVQRIFGSADDAELDVSKFRYDLKKVQAFFGEGKFGPKDFKYHILPSGNDRLKVALEMKTDGGWTPEEFLAANSLFEQSCKQAVVDRRTIFYFHVAPDSFETYLRARAKSEQFRVPAGWGVWEGDKLEPKASLVRETVRYNLDSLPREAYRSLADVVGTFMVTELNNERNEFTQRIAAAVPKEMTDPAEKQKFIDSLTVERNLWDARNFQSWTMSIFQAALAAGEAKGEAEILMEAHPPEIPHIYVFKPGGPPSAPTPPPPPKPDPKTKPTTPTGPTKLILD